MAARVKIRTNYYESVDGNDEANHGRSSPKSCPKGGSWIAMEARAGSDDRWHPKDDRRLGSLELVIVKVMELSAVEKAVATSRNLARKLTGFGGNDGSRWPIRSTEGPDR